MPVLRNSVTFQDRELTVGGGVDLKHPPEVKGLAGVAPRAAGRNEPTLNVNASVQLRLQRCSDYRRFACDAGHT